MKRQSIRPVAAHIAALVIYIVLGGFASAQANLTGPETVEPYSTHRYTYEDGNNYLFSNDWEVINGTEVSSGGLGATTYIIDVQWGGLGIGSVTFKDGDTVMQTLTVSIENAPEIVEITEVTELNLIHSVTPRVATADIATLDNEGRMEAVTYYDGLGRPRQSIGIMSGGNREDIVTPMAYDAFGRMSREYLPYSDTTAIGSYRVDALDAVHDYYDAARYEDDFPGMDVSEINPYSEKVLESSPLSRVMEQAAPGRDWKLGNGHVIGMEYLTNASPTEVHRYSAGLTKSVHGTAVLYTPTLQSDGHYGIHELHKTVTRDENHDGTASRLHTTEEFKNKQGQVVLKRTYALVGGTETAHDTYYVYDDFGNLSFVLPPKSEAHADRPDATELAKLCYQYRYDDRNRLVEKRIPGKDWEYIVYNRLDRPILTRDANLGAQNRWLFTKYDVFGRVAYTGYITSGSSREALQDAANAVAVTHVTKLGSASSLAGTTIYYSNSGYPTTNISEIYTINYYDGYAFDLDGGSSQPSYGITPITGPKGLATGSKVRVLGTEYWITTVTYYDDRGRPIYVYAKNDYLGTMDDVKNQYSFDGRVTETTARHYQPFFGMKQPPPLTIIDQYSYDHANRLKEHRQKINSATLDEVIVANTYDDLGQLVGKGVGGKQNTERLQKVDYRYNIRGWLKAINDPGADLGHDLFAFGINYNTRDHSGTELYNGNISETEWKTANDNVLRWYSYGYDALNRITSGTSGSGNYDLVSVGYDKNGNITDLHRMGHKNGSATAFGHMDDLVYTYETKSNRLKKVLDNGEDGYGFRDGADAATEYTYDENGNMLRDHNKGITTDIAYNHLNLPTQVTLASGNIQYIYDATGAKQRKIVSTGTTTDYAGSFIYENGVLKMFSHPEGYVEPPPPEARKGTPYKHVYQYRDHLGNIRLTYDQGDYQSYVDDDFYSEHNGWGFQGGSANGSIAIDNGRLKVNVTNAYNGAQYRIGNSFSVGDEVRIELDLDKGNTDGIRIMVIESDGQNWFGYALDDNAASGDYSFTYTIGSMPRLDLKIDKRFSAVDDGVSTYFYIDNVLATTGTLGIIEENNYYPFGLKHRGYNNNVSANVNSVASKFGFQGQETQDELGLNWSSFRWRNADPAIGRFFNIDPLAEEFPHNGVYNFSENRVIDAIELEGLEKVSVHLVMEVTLNNSNTDTNNTFDVIATATLDIGNNNHINYSVALPDLGSTVFGDWSEKNGLSSYAQNSIDHKKYDGILRTGIGIPDFFAEAGLKSAIESFNSERESNESAEDEGVADLVNYLLNSGLQLIESDIMDVFYSYDGSETTGTDENGNKTKRKFTHTYTGRADNLEFTKEGIKFKGTFIVRYTEEETTTEDDD